MVPIVVVSWNHLETTTRPCLEALRRFTGRRYRVLCVDNGSADGTPAWLTALARRDPRVEPVLLPENRGWSAGTLAGLDRVDGGADAVCLLNSDTLVTPGWLDRLCHHLAADRDLAAISPLTTPADELLDGRAARSPEPAAPLAVPGTGPAAAPPPLDRVLEVACRAAERFPGRVEPGLPTGACVLVARHARDGLRRYLTDHAALRGRPEELAARLREHRTAVAMDTYVHHTRGGSGGYFDHHAA